MLSPEKLNHVQKEMSLFFPGMHYSEEKIQEMFEDKELLFGKDSLVSYLQSALFTESQVEVLVDNNPRTFFTSLVDFPPSDPEECEKYTPNSYLKTSDIAVLFPVEPGIGNHLLRRSRKIVVRVFTSLYSVEFPVFFQKVVPLEAGSGLAVTFPEFGVVVRGTREFRAKVPRSTKIKTSLKLSSSKRNVEGRLYDISASGASIAIPRFARNVLQVAEVINIQAFIDQKLVLSVNAEVRHISKVRTQDGIQFVCGVQFDLENQTIATLVESLVAKVQRYHLQQISNYSARFDVDLIA